MNYVKQTWDEKTWGKGQKFLQDSLNHMEAGIAQGGGGGVTADYIELSGWSEDGEWHTGGTLTDLQAATLVASELNYIWMNGMHRLDFRYKQTENNLATYSSNDGEKCHVIEVILSNKTWRYKHELLQPKLTAGTGISISDSNVISATKQGKTWTEITLSATDILTLAKGGELVHDLTTEYNPADFKNDYFLTKVQQTGVDYGHMVYPVEPMTSVRVALDSFANVSTYMSKTLIEGMNNYGFFHNYYKTQVIFAGTPNGESSENPGVLVGDNVVDGKNVCYVQDVSQQYWEYNVDDSEYGKVLTQSREASDVEEYGKAFVFHFKGDTQEINFLYCLQSSQAAYWDSTANRTKWANIEAGKFYQCAFDTEHDTLRWLVTPTTISGKIGVYATEVTSTQKTSWQNTGIAFEANRYAAHYFNDTALFNGTKIVGYFEEWLTRIISFNEAFGESSTAYLEYIGRPVGYMLDTIQYTKGGITKIEKSGEHVWECDVDGVTIKLIIPENIDEQGVAHRDTYIMRMDMSTMNSYPWIYRHTFTVRPWEEVSFTAGDIVARVCFCAVNAQAGDSSIDYLLHSDETGQVTDWILPCSGVVGIATGSGQAVTKWFTALRVMAGWTNDDARCIYINYIDDSGAVQKVELVKEGDEGLYQVADFRSDLLMVKAPYRSSKVLIA